MRIINVTSDLQRYTILHFDDGTKVWFLRPEFNQNQPGPGVEPAMSFDTAQPYLDAAYEWLRHNNAVAADPCRAAEMWRYVA